jgi:hypothetical protein
VPLAHWYAARDEYLSAGWWFVAVDPNDEQDIVLDAQVERSKLLKRRTS